MEIKYEKEVCRLLALPSLPKKEWDGMKSFKYGVAIIDTIGGMDSYAICTFDGEKDEKPRVIHVFDGVPFGEIKKILVVPSFIDNDVENWDVDDESKEHAKEIIKETEDVMQEESELLGQIPTNEYFFDTITNDEEGMAFIKSYNKSNRIGGRVPTSHDGIVLRLGVIWSELNNKNKN